MYCFKRLPRITAYFIMVIGASFGQPNVSSASVHLPHIFGDNMVLQRGQPVPVWGLAEKGEEVTVEFAGQTVSTKADETGHWKVALAKLDLGDPRTMTVKAKSGSVTFKNVLVGEVWLCSGQSNMEMGIGMAANHAAEVAAAKYPDIRLIIVPHASAGEPTKDVEASWKECSPENVSQGGWNGFSAAAYYMGRDLHKELKVPVGLIETCVGGTAAERWVSNKSLLSEPKLKGLGGSDLYNGMIAPLAPFAIRGAIWYQGEANHERGMQYRTLLPTLIANWRSDWGQGDFPFLIVEIAPYCYPDAATTAEFWNAQLLTQKNVPNTGLVVTTDIGIYLDVHPQNKQEVGRRLALWALAKTYGRDIVYSGPLYKSMKVNGNAIELEFDHAVGMKSSDGKPLSFFTIAGEDKKFVPAEARVEGEKIIVSSPAVAKPEAVRFAWRLDATPNLVNGAGLPAAPFRSDDW